jgi:hypothetical protein
VCDAKDGDGVDTFSGPIIGWGIPLNVRYRCLFELAENKSSSVVEMYSLG